ncbi:hypothetical protein [Phyllobacterium meliloti]|uniref:hypothetical protein n=1 Tax=Phyllobacterium meliloti TaxID=555317 RepID=UPI001D14E35C|nr:hypothetical protein [Phyllobacterium sp. T1293]UGX86171.1 hypothetical protein LLE53_017365 [Phyllobacterium sp. T1293]
MTNQSKIAFATLVAVMIAIHFYVYESAIGFGYSIVQTVVCFAITACIVGTISHFRKSKFRADITFAFTIVALIMTNRAIIVDNAALIQEAETLGANGVSDMWASISSNP